MTSTGDSPIHIFTFNSDQYDTWVMCEDFESNDSFSEEFSTGASMEGEIDNDDFYVVFDHPNSCDDEDASTPIADYALVANLNFQLWIIGCSVDISNTNC